MKTTKFSIGRILVALLLVLTMAFSFVGCQDTETQDRIAALEQAKADLTAALAEVKTVADAAATKTALEEAKAALAALQTGSATKAELEAAIDKIEAAEAELELVATDAEVAAIKAGLEKAINDAKTALSAKDTELANAIAALQTSANGVAGQIDAKVNALKTELEGKIKTLSDKVTALEGTITALGTALEGVEGDVADLEAADAAHKAAYEALKTAVEALQATVGSLEDPNGEGLLNFVEGYKAATKLLYEVDGEYSFNAFEELFTSVDEDYYEDDVFDAYAAKHEELRFYLSRATSVQEIKDIFAGLRKAIDDLPTLAETLADKIANIGFLKADTATAEKIASIKLIHQKMVDNTVTIEAELEASYTALVGAYDNLLAAVAYLENTYAANVDALPAVVLLNDSKAAVDAIKAEFAKFVTDYFADHTKNAYYYRVPADDAEATAEANAAAKAAAAEAYAITLADEDYTTAKAKIDRYAHLESLRGTMALKDYTAFGVTMLPLYNNTEITDHYAAVAAWLAANDLDDELALTPAVTHNVYTLLSVVDDPATTADETFDGEAGYVALVKADAYVKAMKNIYTTMVKGESVDLIKAINDIVAVDVLTLTADEQNAKDIREDIDAVEAAVDAVIGAYDPALDSNFVKMLEAANTADFAAVVEARMTVLNNAKTAYAALLAQIKVDVPDLKVVYSDYKEIQDHIDTSAQYKTDFALVAAHYDEVGATAVDELLAQLVADYEVLIADIKAVYIETKALLDQLDAGALLLSQGDQINELYTDLYEIVVKKGVDNINISLGQVDSEEANLKTLYFDFSELVTVYGEMALEAQDAAKVVADLMLSTWGASDDIDALTAFAGLLQNVDAIDAVVSAFEAWYETYLGNEVGEVSAVLGYIDTIEIYGQKGQYYDFIDFSEWYLIMAMDYESGVAQAAAAAELAKIDAMLDAFRANGAVDAKLVTVPATDDVKAIFDAIVGYYKTYWNDDFTIDADATDAVITKTYDTLTEYAHLALATTELDADGITEDAVEVYVISKHKVAQAMADMQDIKDLIDALPTDPSVDYAAIIADTPDIITALTEYYAEYYNGVADNTLFGATAAQGEAYILAFHKLDQLADVYKAYNDAEAQLATQDLKNRLWNLLPISLQLFAEAETLADVEFARESGINTANTFVAEFGTPGTLI